MSIQLSEISTLPPKDYKKKKTEAKTIDMVVKIGELQHKLYAEASKASWSYCKVWMPLAKMER